MQLGKVIGSAVTTIKHPSLTGWKLLVVQALAADKRSADGDPLLVVDALGAGIGQLVMISSDGRGTRELVGDNRTPVRWTVMGIVDE